MKSFNIKLSKNLERRFLKFEIIRKEIIIFDSENLIFLDVSNYENNHEIDVKYINYYELDYKHDLENEDKIKYSNVVNNNETLDGVISEHKDNKFSKRAINELFYVKNLYGNMILLPDRTNNSLVLLNLFHSSNKYIGTDDASSMNFKIPVIVISIFCILVYQYFKKGTKTPNKPSEEETKEIMEQLKKYGNLKPQSSASGAASAREMLEKTVSKNQRENAYPSYNQYAANKEESEVYTDDEELDEEDVMNYGEELDKLNRKLKRD